MKKSSVLKTALLLSFLLTGCQAQSAQKTPDQADSTNQTVETDSENTNPSQDEKSTDSTTEQTDSSTADSEKQTTDQNAETTAGSENDATAASHTGEQTDETTTNSQTSTQSQTAAQASTSTTDTTGDYSQLASQLSTQFAQALNNAGATSSQVAYQTSQTGNAQADFTAQANGGTIQVFVTAAKPGNSAKATFDANTANDESQQMSIMNEWTNGGKTVRVVRNNMANTNYVEVLDENENTTIHIVDSLPDQLDTVLNALQAIGYPTA